MVYLHSIIQLLFGTQLRTKIALLLIVAVALPSLLLGALVLVFVNQNHSTDVENFELQVVAQKEEEIKKFFADTIGIIELRVTYSGKKEIDVSQQKSLLQGLLDNNQSFEEAVFLNTDGLETARVNRTSDALPLLDRSLQGYFTLLAEGHEYTGPVYQTEKGPMMTIASPVYNKNNDIIQYLVADVNLTQIMRSVQSSQLGNNGYIILLDDTNHVIVSGHSGIAPGEDMTGKPLVVALTPNSIAKKVTFYKSDVSGVPVVGYADRMPKLGWLVLAEWPLDDALAVMNDIKREVLLLTIAGIISIILLAPIIARQITLPIELLTEGAARVAKGDFSKPISIVTHDELESLGASFNAMEKGLKDLEELRTEFVHIITHELRAPITAIRGYASLIREGDVGTLPPQAMHYIDAMWQSANHLSELVNDLLDSAKIEAGKFTLECKPEMSSSIMSEVVTELEPLASERGMNLVVSGEGVPAVLADRTRLKQVITNLVSNAIKYGSEKGVVTLNQKLEEGHVRISVTNLGKGIPREQQKQVFEKYFRADSGSKIIGTGLGLYITKQLVEKMEGTISFTSVPDGETTFSFTLRVAKS